jgi:uncharacterized protein YndB with AHSA1/START domain
MSLSLTDRPDGRHELTLQQFFAFPVEQLWAAVTTPEQLSRWYPARVTIPDLATGAEMGMDYGDGWTTTATITELDPPRLFAFTERALEAMTGEGDNEIRIALDGEGAGCLMTFTQVFDDRAAAGSYSAGWQGCFAALDAMLSGIEPPADTTARRRHEANLAALGLDRGTLMVGDAGWDVTIARQLMGTPRPALWDALTGGAEPVEGGPVPERMVPAGFEVSPVVAVEPGTMLTYAWLVDGVGGAGSIRWELGDGPGGARITLLHRGTKEHENRAERVLRAWEAHIAEIVASFGE